MTTNPHSQAIPTHTTSVARRAFWFVVALVHVPGLVGSLKALLALDVAWTQSGELVRLIALTLSLAFIVAKVVDVRALRMSPGAMSWIVSGLLLVLMHTNVLHRTVGVDVTLVGGSALTTVVMVAGADIIRKAARTPQGGYWSRLLAVALRVLLSQPGRRYVILRPLHLALTRWGLALPRFYTVSPLPLRAPPARS